MTVYEPELGQMLFGNAYAAHDLGAAEGMVANELYALSEMLGEREPENQAHGILGGGWAYGQDFANDTFEMHPYWWGDCECGFDDVEAQWDAQNSHAADCWYRRYHDEHERVWDSDTTYDAKTAAMDAWATDNGWDGRPGVAAYCDCGVSERWQEWRSAHDHRPDCRIVLPNFRCGNVEVRWYKYIGRGMSVNREVSRGEWRDIFARCFASLTDGPEESPTPEATP